MPAILPMLSYSTRGGWLLSLTDGIRRTTGFSSGGPIIDSTCRLVSRRICSTGVSTRPSAVARRFAEHILGALQLLQRDRRGRIGDDGFLKFADGFLEFPVGASASAPGPHASTTAWKRARCIPIKYPRIARILIHGLLVELQRHVPVFLELRPLGPACKNLSPLRVPACPGTPPGGSGKPPTTTRKCLYYH